jgi:two-component sensor histidine kinase
VTDSELPRGADRCLVIGIGASAGGVEALEILFGSMPSAVHAAFVIVTHLGPHRESLLTEIIARRTSLPVHTAENGGQLRPGHVYVLPADAVVTVLDGRLQLKPIEEQARERNPIDIFFASLARDLTDRAVGIVMSGAGSDGTLGVKAIKQEGGLTIAQGSDGAGPASEGMPSSAIATGLVDLVLPAEHIGAKLEQYERSLRSLSRMAEETDRLSGDETLKETCDRLQATIEEYETALEELTAKFDELHRSNADLSNLFESTQIATVFLDKNLLIRSFTPAVTRVVNLIPSDRGRPITDIAHQLEDVDLGSEVRRVLQERRSHERPVRMRNGQIFHLMRVLPYRTVDESIDGALLTFVDITDILAAEEQQRTLVAELNHRVRNMLQVVIGLANQTLHRSADLKAFETSFMGRMQSLARAYELVSRGGWKKVPIFDLLRTQLAPFAGERERYNLEGEQILLNTNAALALGLVLYELATNAIKYGALSVSDGRVHIAWRLRDGDSGQLMLSFRWEEHGGPRVAQPARRGFGSELLQRQLMYELKGQATMEFAEEGLKVLLEIPASGAVVA